MSDTYPIVSDRIQSASDSSDGCGKELVSAPYQVFTGMYPTASTRIRAFVSCLYRACIGHVSKHTFVQDTTQLCTGNDTFPGEGRDGEFEVENWG